NTRFHPSTAGRRWCGSGNRLPPRAPATGRARQYGYVAWVDQPPTLLPLRRALVLPKPLRLAVTARFGSLLTGASPALPAPMPLAVFRPPLPPGAGRAQPALLSW